MPRSQRLSRRLRHHVIHGKERRGASRIHRVVPPHNIEAVCRPARDQVGHGAGHHFRRYRRQRGHEPFPDLFPNPIRGRRKDLAQQFRHLLDHIHP